MSDGAIISKDAFLKASLPESEFNVPGLGTIRLRGLSRAEVVRFAELDFDGREVHTLACGIVAPELTEDEVREWRSTVVSRTVRLINDEIIKLSALNENAVGDAKRSFQEEQ